MRRRFARISWLAAVATVLLAVIFSQGCLAQQPSFVSLEFPGATGTQASAIDDQGEVVGIYTDTSGQTHGFLWMDGEYTHVRERPLFQSISSITIDSAGDIAGVFLDSAAKQHGFIRMGGAYRGRYAVIDAPPWAGPDRFEVTGVNSKGEIVGSYTTPAGSRAFQLNGNEYGVILPTKPDKGASVANAIDDQGDVVGTYSDDSGAEYGFEVRQGQVYTVDDSASPGSQVELVSINAGGQILGLLQTGSDKKAFVLTGDTYTEIDGPPGQTRSQVAGFNNKGQVVGSYIDSGGVSHGYLMTLPAPAAGSASTGSATLAVTPTGSIANYTPISFPTPPPARSVSGESSGSRGQNTRPLAINNNGEILGTVDSPAGTYLMTVKNGAYSMISLVSGVAGIDNVVGLDDRGDIAINYLDKHNGSLAYLITDGRQVPVAGLPGAKPGTVRIDAIESSGALFGECSVQGRKKFFAWKAGAYSPIDLPRGGTSLLGRFQNIVGMSASRVVIGDYDDSSNNQHGGMLENGAFSPIDYVKDKGWETWVTGINGQGQIIGYSNYGTDTRPFLYSGGAFYPLEGPPGPTNAMMTGINDKDEIVGWNTGPDGQEYGFLTSAPPLLATQTAAPLPPATK